MNISGICGIFFRGFCQIAVIVCDSAPYCHYYHLDECRPEQIVNAMHFDRFTTE